MHYLERLSQYLLVLGIPGLFLISLLDSAAVPIVGGADAFIILLAWQRPVLFPVIALAAAVGSALGCLVLYRIGRAGGRLALSRIAPEKREWVKEKVESNAFWAVFLAVTVPPPFPTKPVILTAGVFRTPLTAFSIAVLTGRLVRFTAMAYLGARFGNQAAQVIKSHYLAVLLAVVAVALLILLIRRFRDR